MRRRSAATSPSSAAIRLPVSGNCFEFVTRAVTRGVYTVNRSLPDWKTAAFSRPFLQLFRVSLGGKTAEIAVLPTALPERFFALTSTRRAPRRRRSRPTASPNRCRSARGVARQAVPAARCLIMKPVLALSYGFCDGAMANLTSHPMPSRGSRLAIPMICRARPQRVRFASGQHAHRPEVSGEPRRTDRRFPSDGGTVIANGHLAYPFLPGVAGLPSARIRSWGSRRAAGLIDHPEVVGRRSENELTFRRGVAGFLRARLARAAAGRGRRRFLPCAGQSRSAARSSIASAREEYVPRR